VEILERSELESEILPPTAQPCYHEGNTWSGIQGHEATTAAVIGHCCPHKFMQDNKIQVKDFVNSKKCK